VSRELAVDLDLHGIQAQRLALRRARRTRRDECPTDKAAFPGAGSAPPQW
jgi:hypothetical protein